MTIGGTRYVVAPCRAIVERERAYAQVVKAIAVGAAPRYTTSSVLVTGARPTSRTSAGVNGRQTTVPARHAPHVTAAADARSSTGFSMMTAAV